MRDDEQVRGLQQRVVGGERLGVGDVERGAADVSAFERASQCLLVDDLATGGVDQDRGRLHRVQLGLADQAFGVASQRHVEADEVGLSQRAVEVVVAADLDDAHVEPARALGDGCADAAGADDRQRRAVDVDPDPALRLPRPPLARARVGRCLVDAPRGGKQQREREVGGGFGEDARGDADGDAALLRCLEVDVVAADRVVGDHPELRRGVEDLGVDPVGQQTQQPLGVRDTVEQLRARRRELVRVHDDLVLRREPLEGGAGKLPGNEDARHGSRA